MNCDKCRDYFDEFLSGTLSSKVRESIKSHISECAECNSGLERYSIIRNGVIFASMDADAPDDRLEYIKTEVMNRIAEIDITKPEEATSDFMKNGSVGELTGKVLDNYEIHEEIGRGGMGTVYRAKQLSMDRFVALKVLNTNFSQDDKFINKFLTEARSAGKLNHLNMITVHQVGCAEDKYFFAMEYVDGETVQEMLDRKEVIKPMNAIRIAMQVLDALKYANSMGIIHRDVKPDNIMIDKMGVAKLADLGIATSLADSEDEESGKHKKVVGTPHYMSPEQARGEDVDFRSDIYSLGATLFHMMTGEPPFRGRTTMETLKMRLRENVPSPKDRNNLIPDQIDRLVMKMMAKEKQGRYSDYDSLKTAFQRILDTAETGRQKKHVVHKKYEPVPKKIKSSRPPFALLGAAAVIALAFIGWVIFKSMNPDTSSGKVTRSDGENSKQVQPGDGTGNKPANFENQAIQRQKNKMLEDLLAEVNGSDNYEENIVKLQDFAHKNPRIQPIRVKTQIDDQTRLLKRSVIDKVNKEAVAAIALPRKMKDYGKCIQILEGTYEQKYKDAGAEDLFKTLKSEIEKTAQNDYSQIMARADEFLNKGAYKGAKDKIEEAGIFHLSSIDAQIGTYKQKVDQVQKRNEAMAKRKTREQTRRLRAKLYEALEEPIAGLDFEGAADICTRYLRDRSYDLIKKDIENARNDMEALKGLEETAGAAINDMVGKTHRFKLNNDTEFREATVRGYSNGLISLSDPEYPGMSFGLKFDRLSFEEILSLSQGKLAASGKGDDHGALFLGYLYSGNLEEAKNSLDKALSLKAGRAGHYRELFEREFNVRQERNAQQLIEEILALAKRKDSTALGQRVKELEEKYSKTETFQKNKSVLDFAAGELDFAEQSGRLKNHLNGKLILGNSRSFELVYDFRRPEQLKDWSLQLGTWKTTGRGLEASLEKWHSNVGEYRNSLTYFLPLSGEVKISFTVEGYFNLASYQGCGVSLGQYRLELPLADHENREQNNAGISKLDPEMTGYRKIKSKPFEMPLHENGTYRVSIQTADEEGTAYLILRINDYERKFQMADGLPEHAQLGLYSGPSTSTKTLISDLRISGTFTPEMSASVLQRTFTLQALQTALESGKPVSIFNGQDLTGWSSCDGCWEVQSGKIRGRMKGFLLFDIPLEEYELSAKIYVNPPGSTTRKFDSIAFAVGVDGQGEILRAGYSPSWNNQPFRGWELGQGFNAKERLGEQELPENNIIAGRTDSVDFKVRYTSSGVTYFVDGKNVFSCKNSSFKKGKKTKFGLLNRWGNYWYGNITLRKLQ